MIGPTSSTPETEDRSRVERAIRNSVSYRSLTKLREWWRESATNALLSNGPLLHLLGILVVLVSVVRVTASQLQVGLKFASFLILFVVLAVLIWPFAEPGED